MSSPSKPSNRRQVLIIEDQADTRAWLVQTVTQAFKDAEIAETSSCATTFSWLKANGDPRNGSVDWIEWIEKIPLPETRNYVQRVLENAVVYEAMYPNRAIYKGANPLSFFLGKRYPG